MPLYPKHLYHQRILHRATKEKEVGVFCINHENITIILLCLEDYPVKEYNGNATKQMALDMLQKICEPTQQVNIPKSFAQLTGELIIHNMEKLPHRVQRACKKKFMDILDDAIEEMQNEEDN